MKMMISEKEMKVRVISIIISLTITATCILSAGSVLIVACQVVNDDIPGNITEISDTLSEWEIMELAIIEVESEYDSLVISKAGAKGPMQLMPIYVEECNRLADTEYTVSQAQNPQISLKMFEVINYTYNQKKDIKTAILKHNPRGGKWYLRRVLETMNKIKTREYYRNIIVGRRSVSR